MKFPFLKNLFAQNQRATTPVNAQNIPEQEVDDLINAAVEEAITNTQSEVVNNNTPADILEKPTATLAKTRARRPVNFKMISNMNGSTFEVDKDYGISRITWNGKVDMETARKLVTLGADSVEFHKYKKLLLDRSNLIEFDTQARVWIKGLLKTRAKKIVKMVDKLAIINPETARGTIFSNFIAAAIKIVMPNLVMRKFNSEEEAIDWLL
ncbi:SpoIIAA family protein [Ekhidna sp.]